MKITGYSDRWSGAAGETIRFNVHCDATEWRADLVRLIHGDENPKGPGFKEIELDSPVNGTYPGRRQPIHPGSCAVIEMSDRLPLPAGFTLLAWVWPTALQRGPSTLASWDGVRLGLDEAGHLESSAGGVQISLGRSLVERDWYLVGVSVDVAAGNVRLFRCSRRANAGEPELDEAVADWPGDSDVGQPTRLTFGASWATGDPAPSRCFNGKIGGPALFGAVLTPVQAKVWADAGGPADDAGIVARWDFSAGIAGTGIHDDGPNGLHGTTHNRPTRGVTGPNWTGAQPGFAQSPREHDAIHFHDDDLGEAGWDESLSLEMPADLPSAVYAIRLRCDGGEDYLPFVVRPAKGAPKKKIAFLMPTLSYLAYSNEALDVSDAVVVAPMRDMGLQPERYGYMNANALKSTYDSHTDGSGVCMANLRRPILDYRPKARCRTFDAPHGFPADLCLVDWLETKGFAYDVITDHDLHAEGTDLLDDYRVVLTGSHPEYWTAGMLDSLNAYLDGGGRLMYLGGNGFYWVTAVDPEDPGQIEIRRFTGTRTWQAPPGEFQISLTGEIGGLWRDRGRAPQKTVGVGFTGQGFDRGVPFRRTPESHDARAAFVFDGVDREVFGAGPSLVLHHGAGGFEVDKANRLLGTPAHAMVLASTFGLSDAYQMCIEERRASMPDTGGTVCPDIGADMVLLPYPNGGAVFSVGSISWIYTLSGNGYAGDTSRITENVLRRFAEDPAPV